MLSYVLLAATQLCEAAEAMLRQLHFPEPGVTRKLADGLYSVSDAIFLGANMDVHSIKVIRDRCRKAADDLLDTLD